MKVILLEKIAKLGILGDVVTVKDGYARNFLLPKHKAKRATELNIADFDLKRLDYERKQNDIIEKTHSKKNELEGKIIAFSVKAHEGKLFGSITPADIAHKLQETWNIAVNRNDIKLIQGAIKTVGEQTVKIDLHHDVVAEIKVVVQSEH